MKMMRVPDVYSFAVEHMPGRSVDLRLPSEWIPIRGDENLRFFDCECGLRVAVNAFGHKGHIWFHASISHPDRLPTYNELCNLKLAVFGKEGIAAQVFEAERYHVNIHPNCLHLWGPRMASAWPLPRFKEGTI